MRRDDPRRTASSPRNIKDCTRSNERRSGIEKEIDSESPIQVRALCSAGITRPQRSYDPVRLPPWPPPVAMLRPLPSPLTGLPRLPEPPFRRAVPTTPADQTGARVDCFPAHAAFPKWPEGRHPHCHFRGLLRFHSRYGSSDRSVTKATFVTRLRPCQLPGRAARQLPDQSTTLWVESSSTDDSRLRGARPKGDIRTVIRLPRRARYQLRCFRRLTHHCAK